MPDPRSPSAAERAPAPAPRRRPLVRRRERACVTNPREHTNASAREKAFARAIREMSEMTDRFTAEET